MLAVYGPCCSRSLPPAFRGSQPRSPHPRVVSGCPPPKAASAIQAVLSHQSRNSQLASSACGAPGMRPQRTLALESPVSPLDMPWFPGRPPSTRGEPGQGVWASCGSFPVPREVHTGPPSPVPGAEPLSRPRRPLLNLPVME